MGLFKVRRTVTPGLIPAGLTYGEMAVNLADRILYVGGTAENAIEIAGGNNYRFYYQTDAPGLSQGYGVTGTTGEYDSLVGSRWVDSDTGREYIYINDGDQWYWFEPAGGGGGGGGGGERGATGATGPRGATGPQFLLIDSFSTTVPSVIVKGATSYDLSGNSFSLTYASNSIPATGAIYLTNPSNGTGFPVYFPTAGINNVTFSGQTLTAGVGESITLRTIVLGLNGSYDIQDHVVTVGNEIRWGKSSLQSLTSGSISTLANTFAKNDLSNEFTLGMSAGDYIYVAYPFRLGKSLQSINNGAYGGMALQGRFGIPGEPSLTYTNTNGYAEAFYVYRSENSLPSPSLLVRTVPVP